MQLPPTLLLPPLLPTWVPWLPATRPSVLLALSRPPPSRRRRRCWRGCWAGRRPRSPPRSRWTLQPARPPSRGRSMAAWRRCAAWVARGLGGWDGCLSALASDPAAAAPEQLCACEPAAALSCFLAAPLTLPHAPIALVQLRLSLPHSTAAPAPAFASTSDPCTCGWARLTNLRAPPAASHPNHAAAAGPAGGGVGGPAPQRAALRHAAQHHEGKRPGCCSVVS